MLFLLHSFIFLFEISVYVWTYPCINITYIYITYNVYIYIFELAFAMYGMAWHVWLKVLDLFDTYIYIYMIWVLLLCGSKGSAFWKCNWGFYYVGLFLSSIHKRCWYAIFVFVFLYVFCSCVFVFLVCFVLCFPAIFNWAAERESTFIYKPTRILLICAYFYRLWEFMSLWTILSTWPKDFSR